MLGRQKPTGHLLGAHISTAHRVHGQQIGHLEVKNESTTRFRHLFLRDLQVIQDIGGFRCSHLRVRVTSRHSKAPPSPSDVACTPGWASSRLQKASRRQDFVRIVRERADEALSAPLRRLNTSKSFQNHLARQGSAPESIGRPIGQRCTALIEVREGDPTAKLPRRNLRPLNTLKMACNWNYARLSIM